MIAASPILADLRAAYATGDLIIFAGPGVSAAGLLTWAGLPEQMLARLRAQGAHGDAADEVQDLLDKGQRIDALSALRHARGWGCLGTSSAARASYTKIRVVTQSFQWVSGRADSKFTQVIALTQPPA